MNTKPKKLLSTLLALALIFGVFAATPLTVHAVDITLYAKLNAANVEASRTPLTTDSGGGISIEPMLPENQRGGTTAFFDLDVKPGQVHELSILIENSNNREATVTLEATVAATNRDGNIVHVLPEDLNYRPSYIITDMIELPKHQIIIPANSHYKYDFTVTIPDEEFDGIVFGAVRAIRDHWDEDIDAGSGIVTRYAYSMPIKMRQNDKPIKPDFYLNSVEIGLINFSAFVVCNIVNPLPILIGGASVIAELTMLGSDEPFLRYSNGGVSLAPESLLPLSIRDSNGRGIESGRYVLDLTIRHGELEWHCAEEFEITVEEAKRINEGAIIENSNTATNAGSMGNFLQKNTYSPGMFTDASEHDWYGYNNQMVVARAYEYGLMQGNSPTTFNPKGNMTVGEAITVAARVHSIYTTGTENFIEVSPWYQVYVEYAIGKSIIKSGDFTSYTRAATRAEMAYIFSNALPTAEFAPKNTVSSLPDVTSGTPYYSSIITLYRAGILTGSDDRGTFSPSSNIIRAEAAAIISRVILPDTRGGGKTFGN